MVLSTDFFIFLLHLVFSKQKKKSFSLGFCSVQGSYKKKIPALNYLLLSLSLLEIGFLFQLFFFLYLFIYLFEFFLTLKLLSIIFSHATTFKRVRVSLKKKKQQFNLISENSSFIFLT